MFSTFLRIYTKRYLKMKIFIICIIILPIIIFALTELKDAPNDIKIAIVFLQESEISQRIQTDLQSKQEINFVVLDDYEQVYNMVISKEIVAGYVFPKDLEYKVKESDINDIVEVVRLNDEIYSKFISPLIISAIYQQFTPYVSQNMLSEQEILTEIDSIYDGIENYKNSDKRFTISISNIQTDELEEVPESLALYKGVICVVLTLLSLIAMIYCSDIKGERLLLLYIPKLICKFYMVAPVYLFGTISGAISLIVLSYNMDNVNLFSEIIGLVILQLSLMVISVVLSNVIKKELTILMVPFILISVIVTHPIIFDITLFVPELSSKLKLLPTYMYLT